MNKCHRNLLYIRPTIQYLLHVYGLLPCFNKGVVVLGKYSRNHIPVQQLIGVCVYLYYSFILLGQTSVKNMYQSCKVSFRLR